MSKISIEQWRMFVTVVDRGGFAQAGDALYKTQSTVSHGIKKLEGTLNKSLFDLSGRKAILTHYGESLLDAARVLVSHADMLERDAISQKGTVRNTVAIAIDTLYPRQMAFNAINNFSSEFPEINIQVYETVLSRCGELLDDGSVDIGIASSIPKGFITNLAMTIDLQAVANVSHPLAARQNILLDELGKYRQVVVRDAGLRGSVNSGWLGSDSRITVSSMQEALFAVQSGLGFAWLPSWFLEQDENLKAGTLKALSLHKGQIRTVALQCGIRPDIADDAWVGCLIGHIKSSRTLIGN